MNINKSPWIRNLLVAGVIAVSSAGTAYTASADTLTFGSGVPERSSANRQGVFPMLEKITKATDGRVAFNPIVGGQLVSLANTLQGIRDGVVDSGFFIVQFHSAELPYSNMLSQLTGLGTDPIATMGATNEIFFTACPECREEFRKLGIVPILTQSASPHTMQCTTPIAKSADLKGLKVSTIGSSEARWAEKLGMVPVRTKITDLLPSLQLGQTDCAIIGVAWIRSYGLGDTIKSVIEMPQGVIAGAMPLAFSGDKWKSFSKEDRQAIVDLMPEMVWDYVTDAYVKNDAAVKESLKGKVEFAAGDAAMNSSWKEFQKSEITALKKIAKSRNLKNSDAMIDRMVEIYRAWHEDYLPKVGNDKAKFAELMRERVYSYFDF